jgi:hypothetical protein
MILKMENVKDFMLVFRMAMNPQYQPTAEEMQAMKTAWGNWIGGIAQQAKLVSSHQLGFEGQIVAGQSSNGGYWVSEGQSVSGNLVLKANDLAEATEIAKGCPILTMGGSVEVRNTLAIF